MEQSDLWLYGESSGIWLPVEVMENLLLPAARGDHDGSCDKQN